MTVDEQWRVYVDPDWLNAASVPEVGAELAHVVWHLLADHADRARDQDVDSTTADAWTDAADATISATLQPDALRPDGLPTAGTLGVPPGLSAEEYFALLSKLPTTSRPDDGGDSEPRHPSAGCGSGADGVPRSDELGPDASAGGVGRSEATEIRRRVAIEFREHIARRGLEAGDAMRWVQDTLEPTVPWEPLLAGAVRRAVAWAAGRGEYTYRRPSRRAAALPGVVLPGQQRPVPRISVILDTSGSVDDGLLAQALGEIDGVLGALGVAGTEVTIYSVDAAVHATTRVRSAKDAELVGAGGTDMRPGLAAATEQRPRPDVIIVLTDGVTPWPETAPPGATTIVAILGRRGYPMPRTPAWATRVECLLDHA